MGLETTGAIILDLALLLHGHRLPMHLERPAVQNGLPLIVYATGDAGWKRGDRHTYEELKSWGYPIAGFGSPDYLKHLGRHVKTITSAELARDYTVMIEFAEAELGMPASTPVVLLGVSRGAGLSVAAAAEPSMRDRLKGVVAIALTKDEEYLDIDDLYAKLPALGPLPLAVVQSTRDNYLGAAEARQLFGADNDSRHLRAIPAKNHNFSDARKSMYDAVRDALAWISGHDEMRNHEVHEGYEGHE